MYKRQQLILYSCLLLYVKMGNNGGMAISGLDKSYNDFIKGSIISVPTGNGTSTPIPNYVWFAILLAAVMWFIWNKTTFGKNMFALGSNEEAARVSGVNVLMTTVLVFALAGAMYGWTGFVEEMCIRDSSLPLYHIPLHLSSILPVSPFWHKGRAACHGAPYQKSGAIIS